MRTELVINGKKLSDLIKSGRKSGEYCTTCVFCGKPWKMYVNVEKYVYDCKVCGKRGSYNDDDNEIFDSKKITDLRGIVNSINLERDIKPELPQVVDIREFAIPMNPIDFYMGYKYLTDRGFTDSMISEYRIHGGIIYLKDGVQIRKWQGRIIFPYIMNGQIVYGTGRTYIDSKPKYLNFDSSKNVVLFNYDNIKTDTIILCEGIISSINAQRTTGIVSTVMAGKSISEETVRIFRSKGIRTIYLSTDGEVTDSENNRIIRTLVRNGFTVYFVRLPFGVDPDDAGDTYKSFFNKSQRVWFI